MKDDIQTLIRDLRILNASYEASVESRRALPMEERRFKTTLLQQEADCLCGKIMRTERAIITALLAEPPDPLGISSALVDDLRAQVAALQDTLDLNNDEFARIAALDSADSEVRELCARARRRTVQTVPMIAQLESADRKLRICLRALDLLRRDSKSPDFVKVYCALIEDEVHSSGGGGAEQAGDEQGESQSGARSATDKLTDSRPR